MRRPRTVLATMLALLLAVSASFAVVIVRATSGEREQAEQRFTDKAVTTASLTSSLFAITARQNRGPNAERLGKPGIDRADLDEAFRGSGLSYSALFDGRGDLLATGTGTTSANVERLTALPPSVLRVLRGKEEFNWSDPLITATGPVIESVSRVETSRGTRVLVRAFPTKVFAPFLGGYLAGLPGAELAHAYVVDGSGGVIASATKGQPAPGRLVDKTLEAVIPANRKLAAYGDDRFYSVAPVKATTWRVVLSEPERVLYASTGGPEQWILLALMIVAGLAAAALTWRMAHAKSDLRRTYDELEVTYSDLERSNVELKRSNAELEQFASVASHDLQEPLRKVQTFGDQLERRFGDSIPDEGKDYLRRMRNASARMSTLIDDLLRFSRVTTHARPARALDLNKIAREVTLDLDNQLQSTHGKVEVRGLPTLEADPLQMRQLLQNLIGNGLKFHRPGIAPIVTLETTEAPDDDHVAFAVTDNGIGFEPVYADRIFRVFERLHPRDVYEGTGIGLALCRKIVERHGGSIVAAGEPDAGARFLVTLPRKQAEADSEKPPAPAARPAKEPVGV